MTSSGVPLGLSWAASVAGAWVPAVPALEPLPTFNFAVEIDGLLVGGFTQVTGLESRLETEQYREGGVNGYVHTLPTGATPGNLTLRHGLTTSGALWNWHADAVAGRIQRRNGTILLLDRQQIPVMWWNFRNGLPVSWTGPEFSATGDQMGVEAIEIAHEGLTRPVLGQAAATGNTISQGVR
ncbi:phage tail protein [Dactylosporangium sp. NPDC051485]|uniref:phage tail protein n=1 Tax=Dactylosporangium sp. NPDC051485 TaxID=3154846 RepID=UPI00343F8A6E